MDTSTDYIHTFVHIMTEAQKKRIKQLQKIASKISTNTSSKSLVASLKESGLLPPNITRHEFVVTISNRNELILKGIEYWQRHKDDSTFLQVPTMVANLYSKLLYNELPQENKNKLKNMGIRPIKL